MAIKNKTCSGAGQAKGYGCNKPLTFTEKNGIKSYNSKYGLCPTCQYEWATSNDAGKVWFSKQLIQNKKKKEKEERKNHIQAKSLSLDWGKKLQTEINAIVRTIDKGLPCLARRKRGQIHAGHVFARGGNQTIRYNLHNIHRQNAQSNHFQNDDGLLREGLISEYGQDYMDFISALRQTPSLTFNNVEYRDLTNKARVILKSLKDDNKIYSKSERIEVRNRINSEMEIYSNKYCVFK